MSYRGVEPMGGQMTELNDVVVGDDDRWMDCCCW